jgi:hypothetical protein
LNGRVDPAIAQVINTWQRDVVGALPPQSDKMDVDSKVANSNMELDSTRFRGVGPVVRSSSDMSSVL